MKFNINALLDWFGVLNGRQAKPKDTYVKRKYICIQSSVTPSQQLSFNDQAKHIHQTIMLRYGTNEKTV